MSNSNRSSVGRPPRYDSPEEMQERVDQYFKDCDGRPLTVDGKPVFDKHGYPIIVGQRPYTVTGLALALGFNSRQTLLNYQGKKGFREVLMHAKMRIEAYTEERLFDKDGANGAKFSLQNNFKGWNEAVKDAASAAAASAVKIICDIPMPETADSDADSK